MKFQASVWIIATLGLFFSGAHLFMDLPSVPRVRQEIATIDYNRDILPILSSKCFSCHGPDVHARKGGFRLDQREFAIKPARSGDIPILPGKSQESEVIHRVYSADESLRMPPNKGGKPLTESEKDLIKCWIDQGAAYQQHWVFLPVRRSQLPSFQDKSWVKNEIDAFILAQLEKEGFHPSPPADRVTLIRRLSLDLRGLPPSLQEVDEFCADPAENAYEKLVDRMLASPHYGEKMAQIWLDLARYGDTSGFHFDSTRQMWLWRDWVINAFNKNIPFDQFSIEQLAGDLLPHATIEQKIASGFNRNTRFNEEGGVDPEEYVIRYTVDRTNTLGQVWLGLTLGCAECHSHKYDPISQKEYYQLYAYFSGIAEPMTSGNHGQPLLPLLKVPTPEQTRMLADYQAQRGIVEKAILTELQRVHYQDPLANQSGKLTKIDDDERYYQSQLVWEIKEKGNMKLPPQVLSALKLTHEQRSEAEVNLLREYYLRKIYEGTRDNLGPLEDDFEELTQKIKKVEDEIPHSLISQELPQPRPAHVLIRGDFQHKGEKVECGVPAVLPPFPVDQPNNRLGMARWLFRSDHPLTARVTVNRLWAQMFGQGIVRTVGDFGSQADYPTHPELLDWLASEFMSPASQQRKPSSQSFSVATDRADKQAWDVKRILRMMALSSAYQQSSAVTTNTRHDPVNRWLARASRHRLTAEEIRDSALAIAGLLNHKIGGPSFMPYQPRDFYKGKNEDWTWKNSEGEEQYRRGLYAFWRRNSLHPMFAVLDAPTRDECTVFRPRTNTPLQALVTLNDPTFVEAARVFAQKILNEGPQDVEGRLKFAFRCATCRFPSPEELQVLQQRFRLQEQRFRADEDAASKLVNTGQSPRDAALVVTEHAAWTALANMLLNLDEVLTRD